MPIMWRSFMPNLPVNSVHIRIDGNEVAVRPGISVAAALLTEGYRSWRTTRGQQQPRGIFCGIGACFDCLVVLNDQPNVRACMTTVEPGDEIATQEGTGHV